MTPVDLPEVLRAIHAGGVDTASVSAPTSYGALGFATREITPDGALAYGGGFWQVQAGYEGSYLCTVSAAVSTDSFAWLALTDESGNVLAAASTGAIIGGNLSVTATRLMASGDSFVPRVKRSGGTTTSFTDRRITVERISYKARG